MKADQLLTLAINTLNRWTEEYKDLGEQPEATTPAQLALLEYELKTVQAANGDKSLWRPTTRIAIQLAYAIMNIEED
jgi:hypothetical protein